MLFRIKKYNVFMSFSKTVETLDFKDANSAWQYAENKGKDGYVYHHEEVKEADVTFEKLHKNDVFKLLSNNGYYRKMYDTHAAWIINGAEYRKCECIAPDAEVELIVRMGDYLPLAKIISS
jgi:hypothetical protein